MGKNRVFVTCVSSLFGHGIESPNHWQTRSSWKQLAPKAADCRGVQCQSKAPASSEIFAVRQWLTQTISLGLTLGITGWSWLQPIVQTQQEFNGANSWPWTTVVLTRALLFYFAVWHITQRWWQKLSNLANSKSFESPFVSIFDFSSISIQFLPSPCSQHVSTMTQLAVALFLEKWSAMVAKQKAADLPNLICADGSEPEIRLADVDFGGFHCC